MNEIDLLHVRPPRISSAALEVWEKSEKNAWSIVYSQAEDGGVNWAYTVGLWEHFKHPEIMVSALSHQVSVNVLNILGNYIKQGRTIQTHVNENGILKTLPARFYPIEAHHMVSHLRMVSIYQPSWMTQGLELIWPDAQGRFFDDPLFNGSVAQKQLLLVLRQS